MICIAGLRHPLFLRRLCAIPDRLLAIPSSLFLKVLSVRPSCSWSTTPSYIRAPFRVNLLLVESLYFLVHSDAT
jgi:hypothetical protein